MTNENKLASMDAVGELPDFGNLLLREGGFPHLPNIYEWNEAGTKPVKPCLCETRLYDEDVSGVSYQYWTGEFFCLDRFDRVEAMKENIRKKSVHQNVQWREVQP